MTFISYAQNREDVFLNRVFGGQGTGFYIDIGAYDPVVDSVTKSFYDRGWSGINIEPGSIFERLMAERPRDINLRLAVLDRKGTVVFHENERVGGLSHVAVDGHGGDTDLSVACDTLEGIVDDYVGQRPIDFLKIDAEGAERLIICSTDWHRVRPRIIVVEATVPMSNILANQDWEPSLIAGLYTKVYFDGINIYYVRNEEVDFLSPHFNLPINALDNFAVFDPIAKRDIKHWQSSAETFQVERDALWSDLVDARRHSDAVAGERDAAVHRYDAAHRDFEFERAAARREFDAERTAHRATWQAERGRALQERDALVRLLCRLGEDGAKRARVAETPLWRRVRPAERLTGHLDFLGDGRATGWAYCASNGAVPCTVQISIDAVVIGETVASLFRQDLLDSGIGDGHHGFFLSFRGNIVSLKPSSTAEVRVVARIGARSVPLAVLRLTEEFVSRFLFESRVHLPDASSNLDRPLDGSPDPIAARAVTGRARHPRDTHGSAFAPETASSNGSLSSGGGLILAETLTPEARQGLKILTDQDRVRS